MYNGIPVDGLKFYKLLFESDDFTSELGKVMLAAGRLEAELKNLFHTKQITGNFDKATLGALIRKAKDNNLIENRYTVFDRALEQRNYLTHNIYALLSNQIDETILEGNDLFECDVYSYKSKAYQLQDNLNDLVDIISGKFET